MLEIKFIPTGHLSCLVLFIFTLLFFTLTTNAQVLGSMPVGENVVGGAEGGWIATTNYIYFFPPDWDNHPDDNSAWDFHGRRIKKIQAKEQKFVDAVLVLLSDGEVWRITAHWDGTLQHYDYFKKDSLGYVPTDSASWKKLTGDALYALGTPWGSSSPILYVSRDMVHTWQVDTTGIGGAKIQDFSLDAAQFVYAATDNGLFIQNPDSNVWHKVTTLTQATNFNSIFIDRKNRILVSGNAGGLYISKDNRVTWSPQTTGIASKPVSLMTDDVFGNLYVLAGSFFGGAHIYKSTGGTGAWQIADTSIQRIVGNASFQRMSVNSIFGDSVLFAGTSLGVFVSNDQGNTWTMKNKRIKAENIYGMTKTTSGKILLSTALGIFANTPPNTVWNKLYPQVGYEDQLPLYSDGLGNIYTLDMNGFPPNGTYPIIKSTNGGSSWAPDTSGLSGINGNLYYVDETGTQHYGGGSQYFNTNSSLWTKPLNGTWTIDTTGFPALSSNYVISMSSDHNGYLYIAGKLSGNKIMRRPTAGGKWCADTAGIPSTVTSFEKLTPGKNGDVFGIVGKYSGFGTALMRRSSGTWKSFSLPSKLSTPYITALSIDNSGTVFAAFANNNLSGIGVYFTTDNGTTWTHAGLDGINVASIVSFGDSTYALSSNAGVFFINKNTATAVKQETSIPYSFVLFQNYPNPFNPSTIIKYQIPNSNQVTLKIYDVLGREVKTLVNEFKPAGNYSISFDASKLASGVYFYQLNAGDPSHGSGQNFVQTKKMILIK